VGIVDQAKNTAEKAVGRSTIRSRIIARTCESP
jgi:hypothetical protein